MFRSLKTASHKRQEDVSGEDDLGTGRSTRRSTVIATRVNWLSSKLVSTATATYGELGLGFLNARIILALGRRPHITAARLAEVIGVDPAAVSRALRELKSRKLVDEAKGPVRSLSLTPEGAILRAHVETISEEREVRMLRGFTEAEADLMFQYLERMLAHMDDLAALAEELSPNNR
jgi:DNA-binding MarR family transcriptional regulator